MLDRVRSAHSLTCGVIKEEEDYSRATDHGNRAAFDLDMCKAVAVAILGPGAHFAVSVYPDEPAATKALRENKVDLVPSAGPTLGNEAGGLGFARPTFYDGEAIMIANNPLIHSPVDLAGKKICFVITSGSEAGLRAYAARQHISYIWYPFSEVGEMEAAFFTGNCAGLAMDLSQLANTRAINKAAANGYTILPQILRKDPLAPAYKQGDAQLALIVNWTVNALIEAEELGVTQANAAGMRASADPDLQLLLGRPLATGKLLGLDTEWGLHVIEATGNYGEIWERDLGAGSPLRLDRGENRLWTQGGLLYALPLGTE